MNEPGSSNPEQNMDAGARGDRKRRFMNEEEMQRRAQRFGWQDGDLSPVRPGEPYAPRPIQFVEARRARTANDAPVTADEKSLSLKIIGKPIGRVLGSDVPRDGDGDGFYTNPATGEDNVPVSVAIQMVVDLARSYKGDPIPVPPERLKMTQEALRKGAQGGFTIEHTSGRDITTGIAVGRRGTGISVRQEEAFLENGEPTDYMISLLMAWLDYHGNEMFENPPPGAYMTAVGSWLSQGTYFVDVTDLYEYTPDNLARAADLADKQDQISAAVLDHMPEDKVNGDWSKFEIFAPEREGLGTKVMPTEIFEPIRRLYEDIEKNKNKPEG
jgi:hypothetical protein